MGIHQAALWNARPRNDDVTAELNPPLTPRFRLGLVGSGLALMAGAILILYASYSRSIFPAIATLLLLWMCVLMGLGAVFLVVGLTRLSAHHDVRIVWRVFVGGLGALFLGIALWAYLVGGLDLLASTLGGVVGLLLILLAILAKRGPIAADD